MFLIFYITLLYKIALCEKGDTRYEVEKYFNDGLTFFTDFIDYIKCNSIPTFFKRQVSNLYRAKKIFMKYAGESVEIDKEKSLLVPPISIMKNEAMIDEIIYAASLKSNQLGSYGYSMIICHLFDNADWLTKFYNIYIDQNNNVLFAVIDIVYRIGLCFQGIDLEENCPDDCVVRNERCQQMVNSTGYCHTELPKPLRDYKIGSVPNIKDKNNYDMILKTFLTWFYKLPLSKQLPIEVIKKSRLASSLDKSVAKLKRLITFQYMIALNGICNCKMYHRYDYFMDACIDDLDAILCQDMSPCLNGGECERARDKHGNKLNQINCTCAPAFKGQYCESARNPCEVLPDEATCAGFACLRDPNNIKQGFRCRCPAGSYERTSADDARCKDLNECELQKPCKNGGVCKNLIGTYMCQCRHGFSGRNCEQLPPDPVWSEWSEWSSCVLPAKSSELCFQMPYRTQTRECATNVIRQRCIGPSRRLQYKCPGVQLDDLYQLCAQASSSNKYPNGTIKIASELLLQESLKYQVPDDLGYYEEMVLKNNKNEEELLPKFSDIIYFYLCMFLVAVQIFFVYKWIGLLVWFFGPEKFVGIKKKQSSSQFSDLDSVNKTKREDDDVVDDEDSDSGDEDDDNNVGRSHKSIGSASVIRTSSLKKAEHINLK